MTATIIVSITRIGVHCAGYECMMNPRIICCVSGIPFYNTLRYFLFCFPIFLKKSSSIFRLKTEKASITDAFQSCKIHFRPIFMPLHLFFSIFSRILSQALLNPLYQILVILPLYTYPNPE